MFAFHNLFWYTVAITLLISGFLVRNYKVDFESVQNHEYSASQVLLNIFC